MKAKARMTAEERLALKLLEQAQAHRLAHLDAALNDLGASLRRRQD